MIEWSLNLICLSKTNDLAAVSKEKERRTDIDSYRLREAQKVRAGKKSNQSQREIF